MTRLEGLVTAAQTAADSDDPAAALFDFLRYFAAVVRAEIQPSGLSSLKNNLIVTEILDAARRSAATGSTVRLSPNHL